MAKLGIHLNARVKDYTRSKQNYLGCVKYMSDSNAIVILTLGRISSTFKHAIINFPIKSFHGEIRSFDNVYVLSNTQIKLCYSILFFNIFFSIKLKTAKMHDDSGCIIKQLSQIQPTSLTKETSPILIQWVVLRFVYILMLDLCQFLLHCSKTYFQLYSFLAIFVKW